MQHIILAYYGQTKNIMNNKIKISLVVIIIVSFFTTNLLANSDEASESSQNLSNLLSQTELKSIYNQTYLKGYNSRSEDKFGQAVAISGDTMVIGAPQNDSNRIGVNGEDDGFPIGISDSGAAYVYIRENNEWMLQAFIKPPERISPFLFGARVAISGDTIVISSAGVPPLAPFSDRPKRVYVYTRFSDIWSLQTTLSSGSFDYEDGFGGSLSISGDTIIIGSPFAIYSDEVGSGIATVFTRNENIWSKEATLTASNGGQGVIGDWFGFSVAIDNDTAVIGAILEDSNTAGVNGDEDDNSAQSSGAAYVFKRVGTEWTQKAYLKSSQSMEFENFGKSVAVSNETIVVGASGYSAVFAKQQDEWVEEARLIPDATEADDDFGGSVAISGDNLVIGAPAEDSLAVGINGSDADNSSIDSGAAYVYKKEAGIWSQRFYLKASNTDANDHFGQSIGISGNTYVVGTGDEDSSAVDADPLDNSSEDSGAVYTYELNENFELQAGHSALWYNPEQSGHGINVYMLADNRIIVLWYVYDDQGNQVWLLGVGTHDGTKATLDVTFNDGAMFPPDFDSADVNTVSWGQFELEFSGCNNGLFKWIPIVDNGFTAGETNVTRLTTSSGLTCTDTAAKVALENQVEKSSFKASDFAMQAAHSALWYNPEQSGHGINVYMLDDNRIIVIWYVYDDQGNQVWLLGVGTHDGRNASLDVTVTSGAMFPPNFEAGDVVSENWGQFELEFSDCNNGLFKWMPVAGNGYTSGEINVTRLTSTLGLTCTE